MARPRFLTHLLLFLVGSSFFFLTLASAQTIVVRNEIKHDVSAPLRDMAKSASVEQGEPGDAEPVRTIPLPSGFKSPEEPDPALQRTTAALSTAAASSPILINNFDGIGQGVHNFAVQVAPPDTNGAVGLTQYVQWVNVNFAVFDKTTGDILPNFPVPGNTLWQGFGGACETNNDGDPVVVYDKLNDRWVFGQFAVRSGTGFLTNTFQCIAVSTTSDATGSYNRYAFQYSNEFDDYPKIGVWPDAYYVTFNMFSNTLNNFLGADACAYDGNAMRSGQAATQICFQQGATVFGLLPSDLDGHTPPPPGSPNFMLNFGVNSLNLFKFHVDFNTPSNSTFTGPTTIPVTAFTPFLCNNNSTITCVPQSSTTQLLDSLGDRLMHRLAYRNFGTHESLVLNHSVIANSSSGIRWYEIRDPNGTPVVAQQSTFAPDGSFRWMGSMAMDVSGDIALGYSVSSSSTFPSIAFTGQALSDPRNTLQTETSVISGTGSQTGGLSRWGDYSAMQVDPNDDCTFWYTQEYLKTTGKFNWNTRIASFKFPGCNVPDLTIASTHSGNFNQGEAGKAYNITVINVGGKVTDGTTVTVTDALPAGLTATAISGTRWTCTLVTLTCTRSDALASNVSYPAITLTVNAGNNAPASVTNTATVSGGGDQNASNNTISDVTTINPSPDLTVALSHAPDPFTVAQVGSYTLVVKNVGNAATSGTVNVSDVLPQGLTATTTSGTGWNCSGTTSVNCTRSDSLPAGGSYPSIALTVNVAGGGSSVTNTASVGGGGEFDTGNDAANDQATIVPLAITLNSNANVTVSAGATGSFLFTANVSTGQPVGTVTFSANGLPPNSRATFSPASATQTGQATMMIATSGNGTVASLLPGNLEGLILCGAGFFALFGFMKMATSSRQRHRLLPGACVCSLLLVLFFVGCGGGGSSPPPQVTPSGTYTITVNAVSSNPGVPAASMAVTLVVK